MRNHNHIDINSLGNVGQNNDWRLDFDTMLKIDVDLAGTTTDDVPSADYFSGTAGGYIRNNSKFIISAINVISDSADDDFVTVNVTNASLRNYFKLERTVRRLGRKKTSASNSKCA